MNRRIAAGLMTLWLAVSAAAAQERDLDVPYVPTPDKVVERMLDLGQVGPGDYVMDLGSGDGRIVIQAVQRGAYGHGVDLDPELVEEARRNAEQAGVDDRVIFLEQDLFETDVSQASVVTMYLLPKVNIDLRPRLLDQLRPGTRVVSHAFDMGEWQPDKTIETQLGSQPQRMVHLWVVPADAAGQWHWQLDGRSFDWQVDQRYQELDTELRANGTSVTPANVELRGRRIAFEAEHNGVRYAFSGRVEDGRIEGTAQARDGDQQRVLDWSAQRQ